MTDNRQTEIMAGKYVFPYHHLVDAADGTWRSHRQLSWGYEYLGYLTAVVEEITARAPRSVLEVGCGDGRLMSELLKTGISEVVGIDIDERATLFAKAFNFGNSRSIFLGDVRELDSDQFDASVAMEVLEHIPDAELPSVIQAIWNRTVPGGFLLVTVPSTNVPLTAAHHRHYDLALLKEHLEPYFLVAESRYLHRSGWKEKLVRMIMMNRFYILNQRHLLGLMSKLYRAVALSATPSSGSHLMVIATRADNPS